MFKLNIRVVYNRKIRLDSTTCMSGSPAGTCSDRRTGSTRTETEGHQAPAVDSRTARKLCKAKRKLCKKSDGWKPQKKTANMR